MVPVTPMIPLFKFPFLVWWKVLKTMHFFDLIKSSLCSKRFRQVIRTMYPKPSDICLSFCNHELRVRPRPIGFRNVHLGPFNYTLQGPLSLHSANETFGRSKRPAEHISAGLDVKGWVRHLVEAFNIDGIELIFNCHKFDIECVQRVIEGLKIRDLHVTRFISNPYLVNALEAFKPTKGLYFYQRPDREESFLHAIITKSYQTIELLFPMSIEEVLILTSETISLESLSSVDFNTLLKKWINGWNTELIELNVTVTLDTEDYLSVIFEGINYQESSQDRTMQEDGMEYDIKRDDGKIATIVVYPEGLDENQRAIRICVEDA